MSMNPPQDEVSIQTVYGDTKYYYGTNIALTQAVVPYIPPSGNTKKLASTQHFVVYGDTVTISGVLMNPGMDIIICARTIILQNGAAIDTSGPDPLQDYEPGDQPQQTDQSAGAPGAVGNQGAAGSNAGNVVVLAESILGAAGTGSGSLGIIPLSVVDAVSTAIARIKSTMAASEGDPLSVDVVLQLKGLSGLTAGNVGYYPSSAPAPSGGASWPVLPSILVVLSLDNLTLSSIAPKSTPEAISLTAFLTLTLDYTLWSVSDVSVALTLPGTPALVSVPIPSFPIFDSAFVSPQAQKALTDWLTRAAAAAITPSAVFDGASTTHDLFILASGGRGARGQDGGTGQQGAIGTPGLNLSSKTTYSYLDAPPANSVGGTGTPGGPGGSAGSSGTGGKAGQITLGAILPTQVAVVLDVSGGAGGPPGSPGSGGPGGEGGPPGSYYIVTPNVSVEKVASNQGATGSQGATGAFGAIGTSGPSGGLVVNGSPLANPGDMPVNSQVISPPSQLTYAQLAPYMDVQQLLLTKRAASFAYINAVTQQDYEYPVTLLTWLCQITAPSLDQSQDQSFTSAGWSSDDIATAQAINAFALTLLARFQAGLDFYGYPQNWAPVLTLQTYQDRLAQLFTLGEDVEEQYNAFVDENNSQQQQIAALKQTIQNLQGDLTNQQAEITNLNDQINQANVLIASLNDQIEKQQIAIANDVTVFTEQFTSYVENQTGCSFTDVLTAISAILQLGTGAVDGVGAITGAMQAVGEVTESTAAIKVFNNELTAFKGVLASVSSITLGLKNIATLFPSDRNASQVGLLYTDQQQFDTFISQYVATVPEAAQLQQAVDDYTNLVQSRNNAIVNYNALYLQQSGLQAQYNQTSTQLESIGAQESSISDPNLPAYISFMQSSYDNLKADLVARLYEAYQAYFYWSLQQPTFSTSDLDIATLALTNAQLTEDITNAQERTEESPQPFQQALTFSATDYPIAFAGLPSSGKLALTIEPSAPGLANMYQVIAQSLTVAFPDIPSTATQAAFLNLTHSGTSVQIRASDSTAFQFSHLPRNVPYKIDYGDPSNTAGGAIGSEQDGYSGLSPFATWTIDLTAQENQWIDLTTIQSVVLTFSGTFLGPPEPT